MSPAPPFSSGPALASSTRTTSKMTGNPTASASSTTAAQTPATTTPGRPTKPLRDYPGLVKTRSPPSPEPQEIWILGEDEEEESQSDTVVDSVDATTVEPLPILPKDNDDNVSVFTITSDEDPVPVGPRRESARLRGVRAPSPHLSSSRLSEGRNTCRGRKRSHSQIEESVPEPAPAGKRRNSKRPTESNAHASPPRPTHKFAHRAGDGVERTGTSSGGLRPDVTKRLRESDRTLLASSKSSSQGTSADSRALNSTVNSQKQVAPGGQQASGHGRTIPTEPVRRRAVDRAIFLTHTQPKPQATVAGSARPSDDAVKQFLSGLRLGQSHLEIFLQEGIRTEKNLNDLRQMDKDCIVELRDILIGRGFTAFEFAKVECAISRRED